MSSSPSRVRGSTNGLDQPTIVTSQETATVRVLRGTEVVSREVPYAALHAGTVVTGVNQLLHEVVEAAAKIIVIGVFAGRPRQGAQGNRRARGADSAGWRPDTRRR